MSVLQVEHSRNGKALANARATAESTACFVYVLGSIGADGYRTYVGWTNDLERRLARHNAGTGARSTRGRAWFLLYAERHESREEAMSREWHLKRNRSFRKRLTHPDC
jgi:putative endonuclease